MTGNNERHSAPWRGVRRTISTVAATVAVSALGTGPVRADSIDVPDRTQDAPAAIDIHAVSVAVGRRAVSIQIAVEDVEVETGAWRVFIDTPGPGKPDFLVGLDGHYTFGETDGWRLVPNGIDPWGNIACSNGGRARPDRDVVTFRFLKSCIGSPRRLRVAVESELYTGTAPDYRPEFDRDFLGGYHRFTDWVAGG
jgi:hypothetical protein